MEGRGFIWGTVRKAPTRSRWGEPRCGEERSGQQALGARPQGRREAATPRGLQTEAGSHLWETEGRGGWTTVSRVPEVR